MAFLGLHGGLLRGHGGLLGSGLLLGLLLLRLGLGRLADDAAEQAAANAAKTTERAARCRLAQGLLGHCASHRRACAAACVCCRCCRRNRLHLRLIGAGDHAVHLHDFAVNLRA